MKKAFVFLSLVIAMACIASSSFGQGRGHHYGQYKNQGKHYQGHNNYQHRGNAYHYKHDNRYVAHSRRPMPPGWAVHRRYTSMQPVYFPDYYTFYSPQRGGYYYWGGNSWIFSVAMPGFLANVNLGAARMQIMSGVPVNAVPYNYFNHYYAQYPPSASINIHIPLPPRPGR